MPHLNADCCEKCKFHKKGVCRRYPPVNIITTEINGVGKEYHVKQSIFPTVVFNQWCGEFSKLKTGLN